MNQEYIPSIIEKTSQDFWSKNKSFEIKNLDAQNKYYCLSMFPYPSGKLHIGHIRNYTIGDVIARYKKLMGYNILNPIGWDAFGIPAENAARDNNISPGTWTKKNILSMKKQLKSLGFSFDWTKEINTSSFKYYKWEQMFFIKLYESGIVYKKNAFVNWDPIDKTVLANEQVIDGRGWRSNAIVERKKIPQWYVAITKYADLLFDSLSKLEKWPKKVKDMQKNWINKRFGFKIKIDSYSSTFSLKIFIEKLSILNDVIFIQISEENDLFDSIDKKKEFKKYENLYYSFLINPLNKSKIYLFISEQHQECLFAYNVLEKNNIKLENLSIYENSSIKIIYGCKSIKLKFINTLSNFEIDLLISIILKKYKLIEVVNSYNIKDWCISRQRYWGVPIPIFYCKKCGILTEKISALPIKLPDVKQKNYKNISLNDNISFLYKKCHLCNKISTRETDTFDTFFESSWYYAKYMCAKTNLNSKILNHWLPVDKYIGGIEHANLHLIYARFFCKLMNDFEIVKCDEPFIDLLTQGMVLMHGSKMSKSKGNIIDQEELINKYGADALRLFIMFVAPPEQSFEWNENGIVGCKKFLDKIWKLSKDVHINFDLSNCDFSNININEKQYELISAYNTFLNEIKKNLDSKLSLNVIVANLMKLSNILYNFKCENKIDQYFYKKILDYVIILLSPFAPHITHYIWKYVFKKESDILNEKLPSEIFCDKLNKDDIKILVQINSRFKKIIYLKEELEEKQVISMILSDDYISKLLLNKDIKDIIYKEKRIVNILLK